MDETKQDRKEGRKTSKKKVEFSTTLTAVGCDLCNVVDGIMASRIFIIILIKKNIIFLRSREKIPSFNF